MTEERLRSSRSTHGEEEVSGQKFIAITSDTPPLPKDLGARNYEETPIVTATITGHSQKYVLTDAMLKKKLDCACKQFVIFVSDTFLCSHTS